MKVLLVNPWAVNNDQYYASGFIKGMNSFVDLDFATNFYYNGEKPNGKLYSVFFKMTERMKSGLNRKLLRGIEYVLAWIKIIGISKKNNYDVVHIHWLLMYRIDPIFLKKIKKHACKIILTAHNVLPHTHGEKNIDNLRKIYDCCDEILVHGNSIKEEFATFFPEVSGKVSIQYHGEYYQQNIKYKSSKDSDYMKIEKFVDKYERIFIMFGKQFYNKGTDRLINIWKTSFKEYNSGLMILGRTDANYPEFQEIIGDLSSIENVLVINQFIDDNTLNYAISRSSIIVLPYRHASMSGVIYTAAAFSKPVLCTESGALAEYLENDKDSIVCGTSDEELTDAIYRAFEYTNEELNAMGQQLAINIHKKYAWNVITKQLVEEIYF